MLSRDDRRRPTSGAHSYSYEGAELNSSHSYLLPAVLRIIDAFPPGTRLFDLGCGNGSVAHELVRHGFDVTGVDPSEEGIRYAQAAYPDIQLQLGSADEDLVARFGRFPVVLSLEVVEHLYAPRRLARVLYDLVEDDGLAIVSTPYHGYWKNLAMALSGTLDDHFTALWDHGHIKFWSFRTLRLLLEEAGFKEISFRRVGRIPPLAKSMIAIGMK